MTAAIPADALSAPRSPVATLFPGYFAMVMATGIVAVAARMQNLDLVAEALYVVAAGAYVVLWVLVIARLVLYPKLLWADLSSHAKGFSFLTIVAGTNVLGSASAIVHGWWGLALVLWWVGVLLLAPLVYAPLISVVLRNPKPGMGAGINGTWFLLTVSIESVAVLGALLLPRHPGDLLAFTCVALFTLGIVLYLITMTMVFLRWTFQPLEPTEAHPPAWIAAGAVAITVLAGSNLLQAAPVSERLQPLVAAIELFVVLAWSTATFWFPLMIAIGVWRHIVNKVPLRYDPSYWALIFPIGMYGAATFRMLTVIHLDALSWLPKVTLGLALLAWSLAIVGLVAEGIGALRRGPKAVASS